MDRMEVGAELGIDEEDEGTISTHVQNAIEKLEVKTQEEAVAIAQRHGLISGDQG
jgi:DNA-binding CsgD family transcriptional regulator